MEAAFTLKEEYSAWLLEGSKKITSGNRCLIQGTIVKITSQRYDWRSNEERTGYNAKKYVVVDSDPGSEYWVQELGNGNADLMKRHSKDLIEIKDAEYEYMAAQQAKRTYEIGEGRESIKVTTSKRTKRKKEMTMVQWCMIVTI